MTERVLTFQERLVAKGYIKAAPEPTAAPLHTVASGSVGESPREVAWVAAKLQAKCVDLTAMAPESGRNHAANASAYSLGHYVPTFLTYEDAYDALYSAGLACGCPGLAKTLESGLVAGMKTPLRPQLADNPASDASDVFATGLPRPITPQVVPVEPGEPVDWEPPQNPRVDVPPFPTHILGPAEAAVLALSDELQTPTDIVATMLLTTIAATVRGRRGIAITDTWSEPLNLYTLIVAGAGETKSPALARVIRPLRDIEAELVFSAGADIDRAEQALRIQEKRLKSAEDQAVKAVGDDRLVATDHADSERRLLADMDVPARPQLLAGDMTAEALVRLLAEQGGALASLSAEGGLLDTLAGGRYSSGMANLDAVLQAHDGREAILVNRKGAEPLRVERPCLTLGLAVQPQVLRTLGDSEAAEGRGFTARFLYSVPATRVGSRDMSRRPKGSVNVAEVFARIIRGVDRLCATSAEGASADIADVLYRDDFQLSSLSLDLFYDYRESLEPRLHAQTGDLAGIQQWSNKLVGQTARLAGVLHCLYSHAASAISAEAPSADAEVPETTMRHAIELAHYLIRHAVAAHQILRGGGITGSDQATQLLGWIRKNGLAEVSVRDAFNALRGRLDFRQVTDVQSAALTLVTLGYLRPVRQEPTGGRPTSPTYLVNPLDPEENPA